MTYYKVYYIDDVLVLKVYVKFEKCTIYSHVKHMCFRHNYPTHKLHSLKYKLS